MKREILLVEFKIQEKGRTQNIYVTLFQKFLLQKSIPLMLQNIKQKRRIEKKKENRKKPDLSHGNI